MRRGSGTILSGQPRVRLRYATAPARPSRQNGSCSPEENHIETTTNQGAKSVTDVPGRNCNRCARTLTFVLLRWGYSDDGIILINIIRDSPNTGGQDSLGSQ